MGPSKLLSFFLTVAIAKIKKLDGDVFTPLNAHLGKVVQLNISSLFFGTQPLYLLIEQDNIAVLAHTLSASPDLTLGGKMADLGRFSIELISASRSTQPEWTSLLHRNHLQCNGDTGLLQAFQQVLQYIDLDWSAFWASVVGNKFAFPVSQFFKKNKQVVGLSAENATHALKDYLLYEKNCFVPAIEIEQWIEDIMILKNDTERLEKNIYFLKARIEKLT